MTIDNFRNGVLEDEGRIAGEMVSFNREDQIALAALDLQLTLQKTPNFQQDIESPPLLLTKPGR